VVTLSPDWEKVRRARREQDVRGEFHGYLIPIRSWHGEIVDLDTGKVFMTSQSLFTQGGFLKRNLYGLDGTTLCHPKNLQTIEKQVNLLELLKQGKTK
jgi:hypothetical protein